MKTKIHCLLPFLTAISVGISSAATLVEFNFSGSGAIADPTSLPGTDAQFTIVSSAVDTSALSLVIFGGTVSTAQWTYSGGGSSVTNSDLHNSSTFGNPTRFDIQLGPANSGTSFTVTSVEIDVTSVGTNNATWEFGYRKTAGGDIAANNVITGTQTISLIGTKSIDLTSEGLAATDSSTNWQQSRDFRFMFYEANGSNTDGIQISAIRIIGTATIPEPSAVALFAVAGMGLVMRRRR